MAGFTLFAARSAGSGMFHNRRDEMNYLAKNSRAKDCCKQDDSLVKSDKLSTDDLTIFICRECGVKHYVLHAEAITFKAVPTDDVFDPSYSEIVSAG